MRGWGVKKAVGRKKSRQNERKKLTNKSFHVKKPADSDSFAAVFIPIHLAITAKISFFG
jgi:hypothetical protein